MSMVYVDFKVVMQQILVDQFQALPKADQHEFHLCIKAHTMIKRQSMTFPLKGHFI